MNSAVLLMRMQFPSIGGERTAFDTFPHGYPIIDANARVRPAGPCRVSLLDVLFWRSDHTRRRGVVASRAAAAKDQTEVVSAAEGRARNHRSCASARRDVKTVASVTSRKGSPMERNAGADAACSMVAARRHRDARSTDPRMNRASEDRSQRSDPAGLAVHCRYDWHPYLRTGVSG